MSSVSLCIIYYKCTLNDTNYDKNEKIMHIHHIDLYGHALISKRTPTLGVTKLIFLVNPSLVIITIYLLSLIHAPV